MRYSLVVLGLVILMAQGVNAQLIEIPIGGGSSKCIVRLGDGPEGVTIIPVGRSNYFSSSEAEAQYYLLNREILGPALSLVGLGMLCLCLLGFLVFAIVASLRRVPQ